MTKFYLYMRQEGEGCDYSIGCGQTLVALGSTDRDGARKAAEVRVKECAGGEEVITEALLIESPEKLPAARWLAEAETADEVEIREARERDERAEYERLRRKYKG